MKSPERLLRITIAGLAGLIVLTGVAPAHADEIKVFAARAGATVLEKIQPEFERTSGHKLNMVYDPDFMAVRQRLSAGEPFDVYIAGAASIEAVVKNGKADRQSVTSLMHCGMGVEVRAGAPKPDISSVDAFKRALIGAKSIGFIAPNRVQELIDRLGLTEALRAKVSMPNSDIVSERVAEGELELGIVVMTQVLTTPGVDLVGPLPADIQYEFQFNAAISANSKSPDAAKALIKFLTGPIAAPVFRSQGMEPG
jgi:molybdate transport system substrate-binding protein